MLRLQKLCSINESRATCPPKKPLSRYLPRAIEVLAQKDKEKALKITHIAAQKSRGAFQSNYYNLYDALSSNENTEEALLSCAKISGDYDYIIDKLEHKENKTNAENKAYARALVFRGRQNEARNILMRMNHKNSEDTITLIMIEAINENPAGIRLRANIVYQNGQRSRGKQEELLIAGAILKKNHKRKAAQLVRQYYIEEQT
jgi:hypothetical protein